MAKRISEKEVASVRLLEVELSGDEMTVLTTALTTLLNTLDDHQLELETGASRDEVEAVLQELNTFLHQPFQPPVSS